jgi:hypothetical protein
LLAKVLQRYPTERMGQLTFVLAGSARWKQTIKELGGDIESPAFSELDARVTVLEEELFETVDSASRWSLAGSVCHQEVSSIMRSPMRWATPYAGNSRRNLQRSMDRICDEGLLRCAQFMECVLILRRLRSRPKPCQAPERRKPAPIHHIRVACQLWSNRYTEYRSIKPWPTPGFFALRGKLPVTPFPGIICR